MAGSLGGGGPCPDPQVGNPGGFPRLLGRGGPAHEGAPGASQEQGTEA